MSRAFGFAGAIVLLALAGCSQPGAQDKMAGDPPGETPSPEPEFLVGVPKGMIAAFTTATCPERWKEVGGDWAGRYLVVAAPGQGGGQTVGKALSAGENRAAGTHQHATTTAFRGGDCRQDCASWGGRGGIERTPGRTTDTTAGTTGATVAEGTNAPYVAVRMCERV